MTIQAIAAVTQEEERYCRRTPASYRFFQQARQYLPGAIPAVPCSIDPSLELWIVARVAGCSTWMTTACSISPEITLPSFTATDTPQ